VGAAGAAVIVGCYSLHLYCDTPGCPQAVCRPGSDGIGQPPGEFTHETDQRGAVAKARRAGWKLDLRHWTCLCPECHKKARG